MENHTHILKGDICFSPAPNRLSTFPNAYLICQAGLCRGVYPCVPERYAGIPIEDFTGKLIIPGLSDLHLHAPQYAFRGLFMDQEVVDWLNTYTFPHERRYESLDFAQTAYEIFVRDLVHSATTRVCAFSTIHLESTLLLAKLLDSAGLCGYVGKVNMNRGAPAYLCEASADEALASTRAWLEASSSLRRIRPILTPRCTFFCTDELLWGLHALQRAYNLPVQSHLSENPRRLEQLEALYPGLKSDGEICAHFDLFGGDCQTVMAHCVHSPAHEIELLAGRQVYVAHCPESNMNLSSGIAPVRRFLEAGIPVGLGSDIAAGAQLSILYAMGLAIQASKMYWRYCDSACKPLTAQEAFYLGTKGGGAFFGRVGSFEDNYAFDAVVLDDRSLETPLSLTLCQRLERVIYLSAPGDICAKYIDGYRLF